MVSAVKKRDVSLQTTNDILTDEAPHFAARPPLCHKNEMIPSVLLFRDVDRKMAQTGDLNSVSEIGQFVCKACKNDLFKIRAIFVWVTANIRYNSELRESNLVSAEIIERREGSGKDFSRLFVDLCRAVGVRAKVIEGFTRTYDYRPGHNFSLGKVLMTMKKFSLLLKTTLMTQNWTQYHRGMPSLCSVRGVSSTLPWLPDTRTPLGSSTSA